MPLYLRLFGRPRVEAAGHSLAWPPERPHRLLALLALRRGWVGRAELAALFWPGMTGDRAAANVRKALHLARALPWADALEVQGAAVRWSVASDVHDFELATRDGRTADALGLAAAGELLDGMDDATNGAWTEWLDGERALQRRRVQTLTRVAPGRVGRNARRGGAARRPAARRRPARRGRGGRAADGAGCT